MVGTSSFSAAVANDKTAAAAAAAAVAVKVKDDGWFLRERCGASADERVQLELHLAGLLDAPGSSVPLPDGPLPLLGTGAQFAPRLLPAYRTPHAADGAASARASAGTSAGTSATGAAGVLVAAAAAAAGAGGGGPG